MKKNSSRSYIAKFRFLVYCLFVTFSITSFSQNYVGWSKNDIRTSLQKIYPSITFQEVQSENGQQFLNANSEENEVYFCFYIDKNNRCNITVLLCPLDNVNQYINIFNKKFISIKENEVWKDKSTDKEVTIVLSDEISKLKPQNPKLVKTFTFATTEDWLKAK